MESDKSGEINRKRNQARSQVVLWGGGIQRGDGPNEVGGASLWGGGGSFGCLRLNSAASLQLKGGEWLT